MQFHPEHTFFLTMFVVPLACHLYFIQGDKARVIQTLLFVAGLNTLLQALFGTKLPAVVGGSFAYVIPIAYIVGDSSLQRIDDPQEGIERDLPMSLVCRYLFKQCELFKEL
ncbi:nucleobase-ascorbate transporter 1-like isoform X2 [Cannabis sativa]|uniref:nucleobase-ascorbate transporter 1-like isoform X2 n=1 Tax=Cannabis sativa TaxID=3483 RepID=UPI0029CA347E|nr:nucleobase-ascorbate transporter 1-like isoform X2 [Cannabis sativa]